MGRWKFLDRTVVLQTRWMSMWRQRYEVSPGNIVDDYYVIERSPFVLVLALRLGELVLVRQYRPATDKNYLALPAGFVDEDEDILAAAARELQEETGIIGRNFELLGVLDPLPGYLRSRAYVVGCKFDEVKDGVRDVEEIDERQILPIAEVDKLIGAGDIDEMQAVAAIGLGWSRRFLPSPV